TTKRRIKLENVLARDDLPVVLGGLMREREVENIQQIPGLGSIPILGWLFKRRVKRNEKINLLIIMVPHVVETADDIRRIHEQRIQERYEFLERETNFKRNKFDANVNYRKKAGMLSTVDREARRMESQELLLREADVYYRRADAGITMLPRDSRPAIRAASLIYADIGRVIREQGCDPLRGRAHTSKGRKLWLLLRAWVRRTPPSLAEDAEAPVIPECEFLLRDL
ncbi:MAG: squalene/phytoene synthase family protein, partial [Myxococcales bacterium]|nr:squalene/phytoene synthase family protein [Myxococcales bacterium]